jgi:hypothetical protein
MILISKYLVPNGYTGLAVFPFVFLKHNKLNCDKALINHEKIHLRQQLELLIIAFYLIYFFEFIIRFIQFRNWKCAYRHISFEREAYINEKDLNYLKSRPFFKFLNYY